MGNMLRNQERVGHDISFVYSNQNNGIQNVTNSVNENGSNTNGNIDVTGNDNSTSSKSCCRYGCCRIFNLERWKYPTPREAVLLAYISIFFTLVSSTIGIILSYVGESSSTLAFSLDGLIDVVTSFIILWRFSSKVSEEKSKSRENRASAAIGLSFLILGSVVVGSALYHLITHDKLKDTRYLLALTIPSLIVLSFLGILKIYLAKLLSSDALFEDGLSSIAGGVLCICVIIGVMAARNDGRYWFLDPSLALVIGVLYLCYGFYIIRKFPKWKSKAFWSGSEEVDKIDDDDFDENHFDVGIDLKPIDMDEI